MLTVGTGFYVFTVLSKKLWNISSSHILDKSPEFLSDIHLCSQATSECYKQAQHSHHPENLRSFSWISLQTAPLLFHIVILQNWEEDCSVNFLFSLSFHLFPSPSNDICLWVSYFWQKNAMQTYTLFCRSAHMQQPSLLDKTKEN